MIREFFIDVSMIDIHRDLRKRGLRIIRLIPKRMSKGSTEAYIAILSKEGA